LRKYVQRKKRNMKIGEAFVGMKRRGSQLLRQNILTVKLLMDTKVVLVEAYASIRLARADSRVVCQRTWIEKCCRKERASVCLYRTGFFVLVVQRSSP